jgi:hypothetical protein
MSSSVGAPSTLCLYHALPGVVREEAKRHPVECGLGGADLGDDVVAVAVLLDIRETPRIWPSIRANRELSSPLSSA